VNGNENPEGIFWVTTEKNEKNPSVCNLRATFYIKNRKK